MLVTSGLSFVAALLAINAFVFWIVKKYPLKIYTAAGHYCIPDRCVLQYLWCMVFQQ